MLLKVREDGPEPRPGETSPIAWFAEMVNALDRGDLGRAIEAQQELDREGFRVTYRRRLRRQGGPR